ncbi:LCP family protein [Cellulomonas fimi]|uniref:LCP family protein n=1 Tax=Cellulomonas fimi TaxID=1708 RepID=UPI000F7007B6|nr:LCP family protein [Cellulomonas fimi]VEH26028.1 Putative transcriptional regulator ywtF [Cellulomonas fimi]
MVSIPRDSLVDIPACPVTGGGTTRASEHTMFNEAFSRGWDAGQDLASAAACTVRTVHASTGVLADHAVVVDFAGFEDMVEAIGGVPICVPQHMRATEAGLDLPAGRHVLDGPTALAFARARDGEEGLGDGSDINRIGNQQRLVAAIVQEVLAKNVLTDVPQLTRFLSAGTSSLTVDEGLKGDALGLVYSLRSLRAEDITFVTVPWTPARTNKNKVDWTAEADELWANVAADRPALGTPGTPAGEPAPGGTAPDATAPGPGESTATPGAATPPDAPAPSQTRRAGREPFTANDTTAVCG